MEFGWKTYCVFGVGGFTSRSFLERSYLSILGFILHLWTMMFLCIFLSCSLWWFQRAQEHRKQSPDTKLIVVFILVFLQFSGGPKFPDFRPEISVPTGNFRHYFWSAFHQVLSRKFKWLSHFSGSGNFRCTWKYPVFDPEYSVFDPEISGPNFPAPVFQREDFVKPIKGPLLPQSEYSSRTRNFPPLLTSWSFDFSLFLHASCLKLEGKREEI